MIARAAPSRPLDLGFELSNLCNLHCDHCIRGPHQSAIDRLDMSLFRRVLGEAAALFDPVEVVFTGGEPLAAESFPEALAEIARRGLSYRFISNGWLVGRHISALVAHPPRLVRISLSGGREATHDASRGRGSFRRALLGAATLMSRGLRAELSLLVTPAARREMPEAVELARSLGIPELHFILPQPTPLSALEGADLAPDEWDAVVRDAEKLRDEEALRRVDAVRLVVDYGTRLTTPELVPCRTMSIRQLYVDARGQVPFCCQLSRYGEGEEPVIGDLSSEPLQAIVDRAEATYAAFRAETVALRRAGRTDSLDEFPCLSCARRHGKTAFLARFPEHSWTALARSA